MKAHWGKIGVGSASCNMHRTASNNAESSSYVTNADHYVCKREHIHVQLKCAKANKLTLATTITSMNFDLNKNITRTNNNNNLWMCIMFYKWFY